MLFGLVDVALPRLSQLVHHPKKGNDEGNDPGDYHRGNGKENILLESPFATVIKVPIAFLGT
ncbi:MAG: hypothetical protein ABSH14_00515 [Verrucomicrobiia bacterium]